MTFGDDIKRFTAKVEAKNRAVFVGTVASAHTSIVEGSTVTGAPGQPVAEGTLRTSWTVEFETPSSALIASGGAAAAYNRQIEDGTRDGRELTLRSEVGGFHSVALTIAGIDKIVADEVRKLGAT